MRPVLDDVLTQARVEGFLGPAPLEDHVANGQAFTHALRELAVPTPGLDHHIIDLGSGGGVPALIIALGLPDVSMTLVDRGARRCSFLSDALTQLGLDERCDVVLADAADLARDSAWQGRATVVTARSYGPPAVVAETATRLIAPAGHLVVSEPPNSDGRRWDPDLLGALGFQAAELRRSPATDLAVVRRHGVPDSRYPRRDAAMRKRPLF